MIEQDTPMVRWAHDMIAGAILSYGQDGAAQARIATTEGCDPARPDFAGIHGAGAFARLAAEMWDRAYARVIDEAEREVAHRYDGFDLGCYRKTGMQACEWEAEREQAVADLAAREAGAYLDSRDDDHSEVAS